MPDQPKPRFEPPPWEQEAFERFRKTQDEAREQEELEAALRSVRVAETGTAAPNTPQTAPRPPAEAPQAEPADELPPAIPEARIDAMLIELRNEEVPAEPVNKGLLYGTMAFMALAGMYIIVKSALLFGDVGASTGAGLLLASLLSFVVLLIGLGFLGGAFLLFRKYRQYL